MTDLSKDKRIVIRCGYTDMRYGISGLTRLIGKPEEGCAYVFCGSKGKLVKIIEFLGTSVWLHTKRALSGKFVWPMKGSDQEISPETVKLLVDSVDELIRLEHDGLLPRVILN